jgi:predicted DNA-binding transcriptional regulator YafY
MQLEESDEATQVYWSVPLGWLPEGIALGKETVDQIVRFIARSPQSPARDALMKRLLGGKRDGRVASNSTPLAEHESIVQTLEDSRGRRCAVRMRYLTTTSGIETLRHASVQRVVYGAKMRLVVFCHRAEKLRWFRVSGVRQATLDEREPYVAVNEDEVEAFAAGSVGGWTEDGAAREVSFVVRGDDARWVAGNLPEPDMRVETCPEGIRVRATISGMMNLARFIVGLGGAAAAETPELAERVEELARGAMMRAGTGLVASEERENVVPGMRSRRSRGALSAADVEAARNRGGRKGGQPRSVP